MITFHQHLHSQKNEWVNQVITVNGGKFEAPPYSDYTTVQSLDPVSHIVQVFDTIFTQSAIDIVVRENLAYVAAQDSIIMYNIDTYQRILSIPDSGISKLYLKGNQLIVTKKFPVSRFFVEILDASNLALLGFVQGISGDCNGALIKNNFLYVAVDSGTQGQRGRLAIVNPSDNWKLIEEIDLGAEAKGIDNLYDYNQWICSVNKTSTGGLEEGSITIFDPVLKSFQNHLFEVSIGEGYGIYGNLLYLGINKGIGSINLNTAAIADTAIMTFSGVSGNITIHSAAIDYVNEMMYLNIGNFTSFGVGIIGSLTGDSLGSYTTGINPDGIAIDYRTPQSSNNHKEDPDLFSIMPNPVTDFLLIDLRISGEIKKIIINDLSGRVFRPNYRLTNGKIQISCDVLSSGIYFLNLIMDDRKLTEMFIKE